MTAEPITIRPKSVEEIRKAFSDWRHRRDFPSDIRFSKPARSENRLIMRSPWKQDVRLSFENNLLSCEFAGQELRLDLAGFDVKAEVLGLTFVFEFKTSQSCGQLLKKRLSAIEKSKHPIFVSRALNALVEFEEELPKERIDEASSAPSDYMVLLEALTASTVATHLAVEDPLATARLRGVEQQRKLLEQSGGVLRAEEVANLLGLSRQAVDKRRRRGRLIGLKRGKRGYVYPVWQFEGGATLPHLEEVLDALRDYDPWMQLAFFINLNDRLENRSPLEMLRSGESDRVLEAARSYAEHGAA
jgi:hypothetical protein